jgi:hypothetical protein
MLNQIEETMHSTFSALGKYEHAADYERLQSWLREERSIPVPEIFQRMYAVGDITEIAKIIDMAESTGFATRVIQAGRPNVLRIRDDLSPEEDP